MRQRLNRRGRVSYVVILFVFFGCADKRAKHAQEVIRMVHVPAIEKMLADDVARHLRGVEKAADKLTPGFALDPAVRETQLRSAMAYLQRPPKGIVELFASPRTFMAAVLPDGEVLVKDSLPDQLRGMDLSKRSQAVRAALTEGRSGYGIVEFENKENKNKPLVELLFVSPAHGAGAIVLGIPLWRLAQRITKQLQVDFASQKGTILWAYFYRGKELHHFGTPPDLDKIVPRAAVREAGLKKSPGGFTGEVAQYGRWYGYGVVPLPSIGKDIGFIIFRSDP